LDAAVHVIHAVLAGAWLGGVIFTTAVVSPALKTMEWEEPERVLVRSRIGARYARVGSANLTLLALFAVLDGLAGGFGAVLYAEYGLLAVLLGLVAVHGAYLGRRLRDLAQAEVGAASSEAARGFAERRRELQRISLRVSVADLAVSVAVAVLAAL
jgi:uncharacterized membrane protein